MSRLSIFFLILLGLLGSAFFFKKVLLSRDSETKPVVVENIPVKLKNIAIELLAIGDYYMAEQSKLGSEWKSEPDGKKPIIDGIELMTTQMKKYYDYLAIKTTHEQYQYDRLCKLSLESYWLQYQIMKEVILYHEENPISDGNSSKDINMPSVEESWNKTNKMRADLIKDCNLFKT